MISWLKKRFSASRPANYWPVTSLGTTSSGERVSHSSSMRISAVFACIRILSETNGSLPLKIYRRLSDGGKEVAYDHPLYSILHDSPNDWQTAFDWREMMQGHLSLRGNAFSEIVRKNYEIDSLIPIHPDRVVVERLADGTLRYRVKREDTGSERIILQDSMFHLRGLSSDGIIGLSPIATCAQTLGISLASDKFGGSFFGNGITLGAVLEHPEALSDTAKKNIKRSMSEEYGGSGNANGLLILEEGMKWQQMGVNPDEAQFLETRKFQVSEVARIFNVPPHMIKDLEKATFSNIEQQSLEFVIYTMRPWLTKWEQTIDMTLLQSPEYFAEFSIDALLRGDTKTRFEAYSMAINSGWMSRNEVRELENMNRVPGLDGYLIPLNMAEEGRDTIMNDVAVRLANAEYREVSRHGKKTEWISSFIEKHQVYAVGVLTPVSEAFRLGMNMDKIKEKISSRRDVLGQLTASDIPGYEKLIKECCNGIPAHH